ncbi:MAG: DUF1857 family protein [Bdellovibrionales bacterium]|nr:DUF1857 family protein [Bdellovibrionales bacterium]
MNKSHYVIAGRVDLEPSHLWRVLIDKVHHPEKYVAGAHDVVLDQLEDNKYLRRMKRGETTVNELIEINSDLRETIFELKDHQNYEGLIISRVEIDKDQSPNACYLAYELNWDLKPGGDPDLNIYDWLSKAFHNTIESAKSFT